MVLKRIKVTNFKSFKNIEINFRDFNVLIGSNASGKSNFIQIIKFIKDISNLGLENAISMQGGIEFIKNLNIKSEKLITYEIEFENRIKRIGPFIGVENGEMVGIKENKLIYHFEIEIINDDYKVVKDEILLIADVLKVPEDYFQEIRKIDYNDKSNQEIELENSKYILKRDCPFKFWMEDGLYRTNVKELDLPERIEEFYSVPTMIGGNFSKKRLLIERSRYIFWSGLKSHLNFGIYDIDPKLPKKSVQISGKNQLDFDGSNLAIVMKYILKKDDDKRKFTNLLKDLIPMIEDFDIESFLDTSLMIKMKESSCDMNKYFPASLMSDGTINCIALIIIMFFNKESMIIIEEIEKNLHPYLLSKIVNQLKIAAKNKQIILTTHSPEIIKTSGIENLMLITRNKKGYSEITIPDEDEDVKIFLSDDLGIEDLYINNLLGGN